MPEPETRKTIEPKPTKYRGIEFRSRLEARWAVFLDYYHIIASWHYEPKTFKLGELAYTPDFLFQWATFPGLLEVKPDIPSEEYVRMLWQIIPALPLNLTLAIGDFYQGNVPKIWLPHLSPELQKGGIPKKITLGETLDIKTHWPDCEKAIKTAAGYRFDLDGKDPLPPFRSTRSKTPLDHLKEYQTEEGSSSHPDIEKLMQQRRKAMKEALRKGKRLNG